MTYTIETRTVEKLESVIAQEKYCNGYIAMVYTVNGEHVVNTCDIILKERYTSLKSARAAVNKAIKRAQA